MIRVLADPAFKTRAGNPYQWLLYHHMPPEVVVEEYAWRKVWRGRYDIWHVHWPELALSRPRAASARARLAAKLLAMDWARTRGTRIVWTVHNLQAHERLHPRTEEWFWRAFLPRIDGWISLSPSAATQAMQRFPLLSDRPRWIIPHGHYRSEYPNETGRLEARRQLQIAPIARVIGFFGQIRAYKNVAALIAAFQRLADADLVLLIAGSCSSAELKNQLSAQAAGDSRIRLEMGFVPADRVQLFMNAADLIVLPYTEILNSGSALLALSFNRPILVPAKGAFSDLQALVGARWVRTFSGDFTPRVIADGLSWACTAPETGPAPLDSLEWTTIAAQTAAVYRCLADAQPPRSAGARL